MIPTQAHEGHYWKTNDAADLSFNEAGPEQPQTIRCYNMQDHLNRGECRDVPLDTLELLAAGIFGEGRSSGLGSTTRWTGATHRYGIYRNPAGLYKNGIVVLEAHGGGMHGYVFDNLVAGDTWERIAKDFPPEMIWNVCNQMARAYRAAREAERAIVFRAFYEGRLKKSKRRGSVYVHIEFVPPARPIVTPVENKLTGPQELSLTL
jgi:hypothetical protein